MGQLLWYHVHTSEQWLFRLLTTPPGKRGRQTTARTRRNTAQQHGIYLNKQGGITGEEGQTGPDSRRWWLRAFYISF